MIIILKYYDNNKYYFLLVEVFNDKLNYVRVLQIAAVYYYLCVVALQFVVPIIICLFFTFLYKTLGEKTSLIINKND